MKNHTSSSPAPSPPLPPVPTITPQPKSASPPASSTLLETAIETYDLLLGSPRTARGEKTTANLQQALDDIERLLAKGLDKLVLQFKDNTFYQEYTLSRDPIAVAQHQKGVPVPAVTTP
ncbi:MAG: hypothetical protein ABIT37_23585 [Luteolibacter sp.]